MDNIITLANIPHKKIRSKIIKEYLKNTNYVGCVCFSCGNASDALKKEGINTIAVATNGDLTANRWFTPTEIHNVFTNYFDATTGHLSVEIMNKIAAYYKANLKDLPDSVYIPSGSGETLICLKLAFPNKHFIAVYNLDKATEYDDACVLNNLVVAMADKIIFYDNDYTIKELNYEVI